MLDFRHSNFDCVSTANIPGNVVWTLRTPKNTIRHILAGSFYLDTDATVASRYIYVELLDCSDNVTSTIYVSAAVTANQTANADMHTSDQVEIDLYEPFVIPPDMTMRVYIFAGVAGDYFTVKLWYADTKLTAKDDQSAERRRT